MIDLFIRFGVALHVVLMVVYSSWAWGGSSPRFLWALPWLSLGLIEVMLLLPPTAKGDTPSVALKRMLKSIFMDPITYIGLFLIAFLTCQWLNSPCELIYDTNAMMWKYSDPPLKGFPFSIDPYDSKQILIWFLAIVPAIIAVRHATRPAAKLTILKLLVVNGALLSILGLAQRFTCPTKMFWYINMRGQGDYFATFGYPNHAGTFFAMMTALAMGLLIRAAGKAELKREIPWLAILFFINAAGAFGTLSRAAMILVSGVIVIGFIYAIIYLFKRLAPSKLYAVVVLFFVILGGLGVAFLAPKSPLKHEYDTIEFNKLSEIYGKERGNLAESAKGIWHDNFYFGTGGWSFKNYVAMYTPYERWEQLKETGKINVHNDTLQFLCEHGLIGFGLIASMAILLLFDAVKRAFRLKRAENPENGTTYNWFMSVSPICWFSLMAIALMCIHSTMDLPFRSTANSITFFVILACLPGFLPQQKKGVSEPKSEKSQPSAKE